MFPSTLLPQFSLQNRAINQDAPNRRPPGVLTEPMPISSSSQRLSATSCPCCPYKSFAPLSLLLPYFFRSTWSLRISAACRMIRRSASRRIAQPLVEQWWSYPHPRQGKLPVSTRSRRSYKDFLRRFCVLREEVKLDPDEFDLNFYTYGLSVYGNLPLIEPLESRESKKIEELALVIDTSYSTSGELVRAFLAETYTLLKGRENFFHRMNLHLIQADNAVRQDILIRNEDELIHAMNHFELRGGGGTDFRPAFEYVNQLCAEKKFSNLRGLLYFTDGMGTYPARRPGYDTAFLFLGERFDDANVPPWAMKVVLGEEEFTGAAARPASALADALAEEDDLYRELNNS